MGKSTAMWGKTSGKVGGLVYSTSGGETIVREYNPNVANPSTTAQVDQRAKLKLISQLSASLSPVIAMTKDGLVSKRNKFSSINFSNLYAVDGVAQVSYENLQLTEGSIAFPQITAVVERDAAAGGSILTVSLANKPSSVVSRVIFCVFIKSQENKLEYIASQIIDNDYDIEMSAVFDNIDFAGKEIVIYAYGMIDTSERATAQYGNMQVSNGTDLAKLVATRAISYSDYQFTQTRGATVGVDGQPVEPTPANSVRVFATALGEGGTVSGAGTYEIGTQVTLTATPAGGYDFDHWLKNGTNQVVSTDNPWTFNANEQVDVVAVFNIGGGGL